MGTRGEGACLFCPSLSSSFASWDSSAAVFFHCAWAMACFMKRVAAALSISVRSKGRCKEEKTWGSAYWLVDSPRLRSFQSIAVFCPSNSKNEDRRL